MSEINPMIFREYDIRGVYPDEFDEDAAYKIAAAFCQYLEQKKHFGPVVVGYDARISSPSLANAFRQGVLDQGRDALDLGMVSTPLFYFAFNSAKAAGGAMVTASHNPETFNGLKLLREGGEIVYEKDGFSEIKKLLESAAGRKLEGGSSIKKEFRGEYFTFLKKFAEIKRPLKITLEASDGSAYPLAKEFIGGLENVRAVEAGADLGFKLDSDGDRIVFSDENKGAVSPNLAYAFLLDKALEPGDLVLASVSMSKIIDEVCFRRGASLSRVRVGHANIKSAMRVENARFAGELSGHFYFRDFFYSDSALFMLAHILTLVSKSGRPFSELLSPYQKYFHSGELNFETRNSEDIIERLKKEYSDGRQSFLDGLTVEFSGWWFNLHASKTEPLVRLVVEADKKELMEEKIKELTEKI